MARNGAHRAKPAYPSVARTDRFARISADHGHKALTPFSSHSGTGRTRGTDGSNPPPSATESVSVGSRGRWRPKSRLWRRLCLVRDVRKGRAGYDQTLFGPFSLTGIDAVPVQESSTRSQRRGGRGEGRGLRHTSWLCGSACEQFALLGPVQRQIEFGQTRRGERDGLPALQDRFEQLRA